MRQTIHGSARGLDEVGAFVADVSRPPHLSANADFFPRGRDVLVARAPGTLRIFGGAADVAGARAIHVATAEGTLVAVQRDPQGLLTIVRRLANHRGRADRFEMPMHFLMSDGRPVRYEVAREYFARHDDRGWAAPFAATVLALMRDRHIRFGEGLRILVVAASPNGHGRGSEQGSIVALLRALSAEMNQVADPRDLTKLAAHADHGVHATIDAEGDPWPAASAESEHVLAFNGAASHEVAQVPWPTGLALFGLDVGGPHDQDDTRQHEVRVAISMASRMLAETHALGPRRSSAAPDWRGQIARIGTDEFVADYRASLPPTMTGAEFIARFSVPDEEQRTIRRDVEYRVRAAASYGIYEHARARAFESYLPLPDEDGTFEFLGDLLFESHQSAQACGLSSPDADAVVDAVKQAGRQRGLLGARIGGGGTTVVILARADARDAVVEVQQQVGRATGTPPTLIQGWSMGAVPFGYLRLRSL